MHTLYSKYTVSALGDILGEIIKSSIKKDSRPTGAFRNKKTSAQKQKRAGEIQKILLLMFTTLKVENADEEQSAATEPSVERGLEDIAGLQKYIDLRDRLVTANDDSAIRQILIALVDLITDDLEEIGNQQSNQGGTGSYLDLLPKFLSNTYTSFAKNNENILLSVPYLENSKNYKKADECSAKDYKDLMTSYVAKYVVNFHKKKLIRKAKGKSDYTPGLSKERLGLIYGEFNLFLKEVRGYESLKSPLEDIRNRLERAAVKIIEENKKLCTKHSYAKKLPKARFNFFALKLYDHKDVKPGEGSLREIMDELLLKVRGYRFKDVAPCETKANSMVQ